MIYDWVTAREPAPAEPTAAAAWAPVVLVTPRIRTIGFTVRF